MAGQEEKSGDLCSCLDVCWELSLSDFFLDGLDRCKIEFTAKLVS